MTRETHFQRVAELFEAARDLPNEDRDEFLNNACGDAPKVLAEVQRLLGHHEDDGGALATPLIERKSFERIATEVTQDVGRMPERVGRYVVRRTLGAGGMGAVYLAEQENPRRQVAVKVIRPGFLSRELLKRFDLEAAMLGRLQHPGIAQIHEAGMFDDGSGGQPYFAMEYIEGPPLLEYAERNHLDARARLDLFARVCAAVHHAHLRGVIHRDLKPGNILVDSTGQPKILDFGVARATDSDLQVTTIQTDAAQLIGTLPYMSPEQVVGRPSDIDVRSDVYALGVILYELLAGRLPYNLNDATIVTAAKVITEDDPAPLSTINRIYRGDLNTIVLKALAKEPQRRYASAADFAADIERYLNDEPVTARPATTMYQLRKFARRNRTFVTAAALLAIVIIAAAAVSVVYAIRAEQSARHAKWQAYLANIGGADSALLLNDIDTAEQRLLNAPESERGNWEWRHLHSRLDDSASRFGVDHTPRMAVTYAPDGRTLLTCSRYGQILVWDTEATELVRTVGDRAAQATGQYLAPGPDGSHVLTYHDRMKPRVWNVETGEESLVLDRAPDSAASADWDGDTIAIGFSNGQVWFWSAVTGQIVRGLQVDQEERPIRHIKFSDDGSHFAVVADSLRIWDWESGQEIARMPEFSTINSIDWHPNSSLIAAAAIDGTARIWDAATAAELHTLRGHQGRVNAARFSPDGALLATGGADRTVRLWETSSGTELARLFGHRFDVANIAWNPTGSTLASVTISLDDVLIWRAEQADDPNRIPMRNPLWLAASPDGRYVVAATGNGSGQAEVWDVVTGALVAQLPGHAQQIWAADWSPNGRVIATGDRRGVVRTWDATDFSLISEVAQTGEWVTSVAFSPDGSRLAIGGTGSDVLVLDAATGEPVFPLPGHEQRVSRLEFSPDGRFLAVGMWFGEIRVWNAATGEAHAVVHDNDSHVMAMTFSPDGRLVAAHFNNTLHISNLLNGDHDTRTVALAEFPVSLAFHGDGRRLFVGTAVGIVRVFDWPSMDQILVLRGLRAPVNAMTATRDRVIATDGVDTRVWDVNSSDQRVFDRMAAQWPTPNSN